jgi:hypothetical protein
MQATGCRPLCVAELGPAEEKNAPRHGTIFRDNPPKRRRCEGRGGPATGAVRAGQAAIRRGLPPRIMRWTPTS